MGLLYYDFPISKGKKFRINKRKITSRAAVQERKMIFLSVKASLLKLILLDRKNNNLFFPHAVANMTIFAKSKSNIG